MCQTCAHAEYITAPQELQQFLLLSYDPKHDQRSSCPCSSIKSWQQRCSGLNVIVSSESEVKGVRLGTQESTPVLGEPSILPLCEHPLGYVCLHAYFSRLHWCCIPYSNSASPVMTLGEQTEADISCSSIENWKIKQPVLLVIHACGPPNCTVSNYLLVYARK